MGVSAVDRPEHAGLFEARTDDGFATGFDDAGTNKQVLLAELGIAHALGMGFKVVGFGAQLFRYFGAGGVDSP